MGRPKTQKLGGKKEKLPVLRRDKCERDGQTGGEKPKRGTRNKAQFPWDRA